ncbi:glutathione S-transferase family protein [Chamaesiphon polymorphus]|uniref:glutathione transferase n=1 Tax=Chamaesiphon polymorphus CCALA 037 TaxID=2107692 RepID=A0A2T1FZA9_9CYAN|nr:glutathione S-transferase family protein [Chamaesiphon polymorphus]PSB50256.1 glutathione S-transferase family protein [Chamaesiphon polymorphus CCALA 037]
MSQIQLYSAILCPFAHRVRLTLLEKSVPFESIEIDLQNKPANFHEISPYGKVPVLKHGDNRVWESAIVNEYLEETFPNPPLLPTDPIDRARARIWINFADTRLFATTGKLLYGRDSQPAALLQELTEQLLFIEREGLAKISDRKPYWLGTELSLVDLTFYPWFEQVNVLEHFRGFQMPPGLARIQQWQAAVSQRSSVKSIANSPEFYLEHYGRLAQKI